MKIYNLIIIGAGVAGVSAAKVAIDNGMSVLMLERGKDLIKRRELISGWFGEGPYIMDKIERKDSLLNNSKACSEAFKIVKSILPNGIKSYKEDNYYKFLPSFGMSLANYFYKDIGKKVDLLFNTESLKIEKDVHFVVQTNKNKFRAENCIISTGKYSIDYVKRLCNSFEIETIEPTIKIGVCIELPILKPERFENIKEVEDFKTNSIIGEWEDSNIVSVFNYRPNKDSHKMTFMVGKIIDCKLEDIMKTIKIVNVLANDKVRNERVGDFMEGKTILKHIEMFDFLRESFNNIEKEFPSFISRAIMYVPEIKFNGIFPVENDMSTKVTNLYGSGKCTSKVSNVIGSMASGMIAVNTIRRRK